jgi:hypothetical protein
MVSAFRNFDKSHRHRAVAAPAIAALISASKFRNRLLT